MAVAEIATEADVGALGRTEDELGVLSLYLDASPDRAAGPRPQWVIAAEHGLDEARRRARERRPHEQWAAIEDRLEELAPAITELLDPAAPGRGRALFAALGGDFVWRADLQTELPDMVGIAPRACLLPLLAALQRERPAGLVSVARDRVRVVEHRPGHDEELLASEFHEPTGEWRELAGPANRYAGSAQSSAPQRDLFDRRLEQHQVRAAETVAPRVAELHDRRGWERLAVAGDPRLTRPFLEALAAGRQIEAIEDERQLDGFSPAELGEALEPALAQERAERQRAVVSEIVGRAAASGLGRVGAEPIMEALVEGRVELLAIDRSLGEPAEPGGDPGVGEELVAGAFDTSAEILCVEDEQALAQLCDEAFGVGARLRW